MSMITYGVTALYLGIVIASAATQAYTAGSMHENDIIKACAHERKRDRWLIDYRIV